MSIRTNPMKAVPLLLKHLANAEKRANLDDVKSELIKIQDLFSKVKKNEDELLDTLTVLYNYLRSSNLDKLKQEKEDICNRIRISTQKLLPADAIQVINTEAAQPSNPPVHKAQPEDLEILKDNYQNLDHSCKDHFLSLLHFPENAVMKERNINLWWKLVSESAEGSNQAPGRNRFDAFLHDKLILPHANGKFPVANKFKINPELRSLVKKDGSQFCGTYSQIITSSASLRDGADYRCLALDKRKVKLGDGFDFKSNNLKAVVNVGASYLDFGPQWLSKIKHLEVLQLGRWLHDSPKHHIEVLSQEFLKELKQQKHLRHLSLRGISQITELPPSIVQLESLEFLDLKACHNLETLPNDISSLKKLTHLDLSHCYLLDRMPKGIDKLTELQVLKGFVISSSSKTPCRLSDLVNLKKLERLSIHIASGASVKDSGSESLEELSKQFESLKELSKLEHLKISWGVSDPKGVSEPKYSDIKVTLPPKLRKMHLEGFPGEKIPDWLKPSKIGKELKELNITGGKLRSMKHGENNNHWWVKIVRLKYLKQLNVNITNLQELFPRLAFVEIVTS